VRASEGVRQRDVEGVENSTRRASTDLVGLSLPFTQRPLLDPNEFIDESRKRGIDLSTSLLEDLHRHKILIPFFRIVRDGQRKVKVIDVEGSLIPELTVSGLNGLLMEPARAGRLADPSSERFLRWQRRRRSDLQPASTGSDYLYSQHQMLGVIMARDLIADQRVFYQNRRGSKGPAIARLLNPNDLPSKADQSAAASLRSAAIVLSAIDPLYWPGVVRRVRWYGQWIKYEGAFEPVEMLKWLEVEPAVLEGISRRLLAKAAAVDSTGDFYELIRRADPNYWESLSGDARIAMDLRMSAEVIERFLDQLDPHRDSRVDSTYLKGQRLSDRVHSLDESLTNIGLSPHPSLVVAVEGETEFGVVPKVFATLDLELDDSWVRIENFHGVDKDLQLLAQYAGGLGLGEDLGPFVKLSKPVTRLIVFADREKGYATAQSRRKQKIKLLRAMLSKVPSNLQKGLCAPGANLVSIRTWGKYPFEFAHFSDAEIADAILGLRPTTFPLSRTELMKKIRVERSKEAKTKNGNGPNVDVLLKMPSDRVIGKPELAAAMWPILEKKIRSARITGKRKPPVMVAVERAAHLANLPSRAQIALVKSN
jgi:hypothetical protein